MTANLLFAKALIVAIAATTSVAGVGEREAEAQSVCAATSTLGARIAYLKANPRMYASVKMVTVQDSNGLVSYADGVLMWDPKGLGLYQGNGSFGFQLFNDRKAGAQPFNYNQKDTIDKLSISPAGKVTAHYLPWNNSTDWTLGCGAAANSISAVVPGMGSVTIYFGKYGVVPG
jgi:hypothetical protein